MCYSKFSPEQFDNKEQECFNEVVYSMMMKKNKNFKIVGPFSLEEIYNDENLKEKFCSFVAEEVDFIRQEFDDSFCRIRANLFVIEYGYCELGSDEMFVITGNHKGERVVSIVFTGKTWDKPF